MRRSAIFTTYLLCGVLVNAAYASRSSRCGAQIGALAPEAFIVRESETLAGPTLVNIKSMDAGVTREDEARVRKVIAGVNRCLGKLRAPAKISAELRSDGSGFFIDRANHNMMLSTRPTFLIAQRKLTKHPKFADGSQAHEYGHDVLFENLKEHLKEVQDEYVAIQTLRTTMEQNGENRRAALERLREEDRAIALRFKSGHLAAGESATLELRSMAIEKERQKILNEGWNDPVLKEFQTRFDAYSLLDFNYSHVEPLEELFADVLAVISVGDPQAVANAITFAGTKELLRANWIAADAQVTLRQAEKITKARQKSRKFLAKNPIDGPYSDDVHNVYGPTRSFFGAYLTSQKFRGREHLIVEAVFEALVGETQIAKTRVGYLRDFQKNGRELNEAMIDRLRTLLGEI